MTSYTARLDEAPASVREQLALWTTQKPRTRVSPDFSRDHRRERLIRLLHGDLDFRGKREEHSRHNFHSFAAKFPPQLPRLFIEELSAGSELVLDPMMGSGTAILEALLAGRRAAGFDLDPLAVRLCRIKTLDLSSEQVFSDSRKVLARAASILDDPQSLDANIRSAFDDETKAFIDYWFLPSTQRELFSLRKAIETIHDPGIRSFLEVAFSAIIVTKNGGVSLATDLAHSRPHKVNGKVPKNAFEEFEKRVRKNIAGLEARPLPGSVQLHRADARNLPLPDKVVDLIVTSPPYANAIDYVRAHKFSMVWLGMPIKSLTELRGVAIGTERAGGEEPSGFGPTSNGVLKQLSEKDAKKSRILSRYFSDMHQVLSEMLRVTKPDRCAVVVVGSSTMRGLDVRTPDGLTEAAQTAGWEVVEVGTRHIDRDKRMMPMRATYVAQSGIEERMCEEAVIGLFKPA